MWVTEPVNIPVKSITVYFKTYNSGMGDSVGPGGIDLEGFEIAGEDRVFHKAHAVAEWGDNDQEVHIDAGLPFSRAFQPEIIGYQPFVENIDLTRNITIPEGKGFVFVLENQGVRNE